MISKFEFNFKNYDFIGLFSNFSFVTDNLLTCDMKMKPTNGYKHLRMSYITLHGYRVFLGGKERPGRDADPSPPSSVVVKKE